MEEILFTSTTEVIMGNRMRTFPKAAARRMARNWVRNSSGRFRHRRMPRSPRKGFDLVSRRGSAPSRNR